MKRTWTVRPDTGMELRDGSVIGYVSREALVEAYMDAASIQDRAGGVITVLVGRAATDVPGEMLTNAVVFEWKDRVDATTAAERPTQIREVEAMAALVEVGPDPVLNRDGSTRWEHEDDPTPEELEARLVAEATDDNPDGFDTSKLEDEDVSSIPAEAR